LHTLGILHDMGKLALYQNGETAFLPDLPTEIRAFGADHALTGALVCQGFGPARPCFPASPCTTRPSSSNWRTDGRRAGDHLRPGPVPGRQPRPSMDRRSGWRALGWAVRAGMPRYAVRESYRFLVKVPVLASLIDAPALGDTVRQTLAMLRALPGQAA